jgi:hypothetical protein
MCERDNISYMMCGETTPRREEEEGKKREKRERERDFGQRKIEN